MAVLQMRGVTKEFKLGERSVLALDAVDLDVEEREVVALLGPSGSGKTTLLTIAGALQRPTSGTVEVAGERIEKMSERELAAVRRHKVGFIFQSYNLLAALTALENVQYMLELKGYRGKHAHDRALGLLEMLGLGSRANQLPKRLSGGEQQRVAVARAFAAGGEIILADEPTANLDNTRAVELAGLLRALSRDFGTPLLMVTHDARASQVADRLLWLQDGVLRRVSGEEAARLSAPPSLPAAASIDESIGTA